MNNRRSEKNHILREWARTTAVVVSLGGFLLADGPGGPVIPVQKIYGYLLSSDTSSAPSVFPKNLVPD